MKKILVVISILLISAMLTGCSLGKKAAEGQPQQGTQQPTAPSTSTGADNIDQGISDVQKEEQDLNTDGMSDIDAGLSDIEKM